MSSRPTTNRDPERHVEATHDPIHQAIAQLAAALVREIRAESLKAAAANVEANVPTERVITTRELLKRIPLDRTTIYRMCRDGRFPAPVQLTASRKGWRWSVVERWITERERKRISPRRSFGRDLESK